MLIRDSLTQTGHFLSLIDRILFNHQQVEITLVSCCT